MGLALINTLLNNRLGPASSAPARKRRTGGVDGGREVEQSDAEVSRSSVQRRVGLGALKTISNMLRQQALVMAFADIFMLLTFLFAAFIFALPLVRKPRGGSPPAMLGAH